MSAREREYVYKVELRKSWKEDLLSSTRASKARSPFASKLMRPA